MIVHEPYNPFMLDSFFGRMMQTYPGLRAIGTQFLNTARQEATGKDIADIGMGYGGIAMTILRMSNPLSYIGIEPRPQELPPPNHWIWSDSRFSVAIEPFQAWAPTRQYSLMISRFTTHHFPQEIDAWYRKVASCLAPGGTFLQLDLAAPYAGYSLEWFLKTAQSINDTPARNHERDQWIKHMREDERRLLPIDAHTRALQEAGLRAEVVAQWEHQTIWHCRRL